MTIDSIAFGKALADDTRQRIMTMLCCENLCVNDIVEQLAQTGDKITQPTVSHHLSILKNANLVTWQREGKQVFYSLDQEQVSICCAVVLTSFAPESEMTLELLPDGA